MRVSADPVSTHEDATRLFDSLDSPVKCYTIVGNGAYFMIVKIKLLKCTLAWSDFNLNVSEFWLYLTFRYKVFNTNYLLLHMMSNKLTLIMAGRILRSNDNL